MGSPLRAGAMRLALASVSLLALSGPASADLYDTPQGQGAMAGKTVVLSPGHGIQPLSGGGWGYQRGTTPTAWADATRVREDIHTNEIIIEYLQRYLSNAGAIVFSCRDRGFQTHEVIVDDAQAGYSEAGPWQASQTTPGFRGSGYRAAQVSAQETAVARFTLPVPARGAYPVYVWYTPTAHRSGDALYRVYHAGGLTSVRVDQRRYQAFWYYLGTFPFDPAEPAIVELSNQGSDPQSFVVADAVRIGGGVGPSGLPRWREAAVSFLGYAGYQDTAGDVTIRPRFASWIAGNPSGSWLQDFRYLALHTNAGSGSGRGTMTISYTNGRTPSWSGWGTGPAHYATSPSSLQAAADGFRDGVQAEVIRTLRGEYGSWSTSGPTGGLIMLNAGELRECLSMPGCLVELAYHDSPGDAVYLQDAHFRHVAARAMYKSVARSFDPQAVIVPLPPQGVAVENAGGGLVRCTWQPITDPLEPSAAPTAYKVYQSLDGFGFDQGTVVSQPDVLLGPLPAGATIYVRIAQVNAGGESLASDVYGARVAGSRAPEVLLIEGMERPFRHSHLNIDSRYPPDAVALHGRAFAQGTGLAFDSAEASAVRPGGRVALSGYAMLDWFVGEDSTADESLSDAEQGLLAPYLGGGGALLLSGSEIGWDLDNKGSATDKAFYRDWLKASYVKDDAGVADVTAAPAGSLGAVPALTFGAPGGYAVGYPDVLSAVGGAHDALAYGQGAGTAAIEYGGTYRLVYLGFPLEAVQGEGERAALVKGSADMLLAGLGGSAGGGLTGGGTSGGGGPAPGPIAQSGSGGSGGGGGCCVGDPDATPLALVLLVALVLGLRLFRPRG